MKLSIRAWIPHIVVAIAVAVLVPTVSFGQETAALTPPKISTFPFKAGELLTYEVNFSKLLFSGTIGALKLSVAKPVEGTDTATIEMTAEAVSRGFFPSLFGVKVRDRFTSRVNSTDFGLVSSIKLLEEGKARREQKTEVDRETGRLKFTDRDLISTKAEPRLKEKAAPVWVQDLLSTIYYVRAQPLKDGDVISLPVSDGGEIYNIDFVVAKRELVSFGARKINTVQINAKVFEGRYIKRKGEMLVWVTDDDNRIPIRARIKTSGYTITVELKGSV